MGCLLELSCFEQLSHLRNEKLSGRTIEPMERDTESSARFIQKMVPFNPHNPQQCSDTERAPPCRSSAYIVRDNASTLHRDRKRRVIP